MIQDLLLTKPDNPVEFMLDYLTKNYPEKSKSFSQKSSSGKSSNVVTEETPDEDFSSEEEDEEEDDDDFDEEAEKRFNERQSKTGSKRRISVSAAVLNAESLAQDIIIFEKTDEEKQLLEKYLAKNVLCGHLEAKDKQKIIGAFEKADVSKDTEIITQGDLQADHYFIINEGTADVIKNDEKILEYKSGDAFGELALMYNAPRAATVKATSDCSVWRLDQKVFKVILMGNAIRAKERRTQIVSKVDILKDMGDIERHKLVEALQPKTYVMDDVVCTQGESGDEFFIISEGKVKVVVNEQEIGELNEGEYFGEIALLTKKPRQATIVAKTDSVTLLVIHRKVFKRLLGPLSDILKRNMKTYSEYVAGVRLQ